MKKTLLCALPILFLLLALAHPLAGQADAADPVAAALGARLPGLLAKYRVPGAVVTYIRDGAVAWTQAYGLADVAAGKAMAPDMIFNFGSCGKVLTGWGVMRLVEQGKLSLDAPVNQYLKRWQVQSTAQFDAQQVTLRRLLSHTAGLTVHGFNDYSLRRGLPSLAEMLAGQNQVDGAVVLFQPPGQGDTSFEPAPEPASLQAANLAELVLAGLLGLPLLIALALFIRQVRTARRARSRRPGRGALLGAAIWVLLAAFWIYWFYTGLPLIFPPAFPDLWRTAQIDVVTAVLLAWVAFSLAAAWFPRAPDLKSRSRVADHAG